MVAWDCSPCFFSLSALFLKAPLALAPRDGAKALGMYYVVAVAQGHSLSPHLPFLAHSPTLCPACCLCQLTVFASVFDSRVYIDPLPRNQLPHLLLPFQGLLVSVCTVGRTGGGCCCAAGATLPLLMAPCTMMYEMYVQTRNVYTPNKDGVSIFIRTHRKGLLSGKSEGQGELVLTADGGWPQGISGTQASKGMSLGDVHFFFFL